MTNHRLELFPTLIRGYRTRLSFLNSRTRRGSSPQVQNWKQQSEQRCLTYFVGLSIGWCRQRYEGNRDLGSMPTYTKRHVRMLCIQAAGGTCWRRLKSGNGGNYGVLDRDGGRLAGTNGL